MKQGQAISIWVHENTLQYWLHRFCAEINARPKEPNACSLPILHNMAVSKHETRKTKTNTQADRTWQPQYTKWCAHRWHAEGWNGIKPATKRFHLTEHIHPDQEVKSFNYLTEVYKILLILHRGSWNPQIWLEWKVKSMGKNDPNDLLDTSM